GAQQSKTCKTPCAPAISGSPARMSGRLTIIETAASNRDESRLQCTNLDNNRRQNLESDESLSDTDVSRIPCPWKSRLAISLWLREVSGSFLDGLCDQQRLALADGKVLHPLVGGQ